MTDIDEDAIYDVLHEMAKTMEVTELCDQTRAVLYKACEVAEDIIEEEGKLSELGKATLGALFGLAKASKALDIAAKQWEVDFEIEEPDPFETMPPEGAVN